MNIGYITGNWPSWSETFIAQELTLLRAALPIVPIAVRGRAGQLDPDFAYLEEPVAEFATGRGRQVPLPKGVRTRVSVHKHRGALERLAAIVAEREIRHLHAAFGDLPGLLAATVARKLGISWSVSVHAADVHASQFAESAIYKGASAILACNERVRAALPGYPVEVIPHGLCLEDWPFVAREPGECLRLLFVGRLVEKKDPLMAAEIAKAASAQLTVIGDGPLRASMQGVELRGAQTREQVRAAMAEANALIVTSRELADDAEGIPNVIVEAMASGLPVVSRISGGIGEVLNSQTGWPVQDDDFLCELRRLDAVRPLAARAMVESRFDAHTLIQRRIARLACFISP
ncbi:MAG: glycosyltransferase involved in cell wall biosynthesis [Rhodothermales bacterium]|jgi:glycosyltransferase involved in cell wall biosynthesis